MRGYLDKLMAADIPLYLMFSISELEEGIDHIATKRYLGTKKGIYMFGDQDVHDFIAAPRKAVIDLRTMKIVKLDPLIGETMSFDTVLETCATLK